MSLREFYDELVKHDWFYMMSDDRNVSSQGERNLARLVKIAESTQEHAALFREFRSAVFSFNPRPKRPEVG